MSSFALSAYKHTGRGEWVNKRSRGGRKRKTDRFFVVELLELLVVDIVHLVRIKGNLNPRTRNLSLSFKKKKKKKKKKQHQQKLGKPSKKKLKKLTSFLETPERSYV